MALTGAVIDRRRLGARSCCRRATGCATPRSSLTLATWALYAGALLLRRLRRWQGRQTAIASLAGFAHRLFSLVAVNLWFSDFHAFL